jgi:hypothetical protein
MKNKKRIRLSESEMVSMIENIVNEIKREKKHQISESRKKNLRKKRFLNEQSKDKDFEVATKFAQKVTDWWKGSSNMFDDPEGEYTDFFSKYQRFFDDWDTKAANAYRIKVMGEFNKEIHPNNKYYDQVKKWLEEIVDNIDDTFQNECWLELESSDGQFKDFMVDPEIDVDFFTHD